MVASAPTSLATKLGILEGSSLVLLGAPEDLRLELPTGARVRRRAGGKADVVVAFFTGVPALEARLDRLAPMIFPAGGLWIAWPKRSSRLETDMTDDHVRSLALPLGLVDNKVCAIDETWTGLRLVWRRSVRDGQVLPRR